MKISESGLVKHKDKSMEFVLKHFLKALALCVLGGVALMFLVAWITRVV